VTAAPAPQIGSSAAPRGGRGPLRAIRDPSTAWPPSHTAATARQSHGAFDASVTKAITSNTSVPTAAATTRSGRRR
jgi:hypothetical protein